MNICDLSVKDNELCGCSCSLVCEALMKNIYDVTHFGMS